jgi:hypothetical protein
LPFSSPYLGRARRACCGDLAVPVRRISARVRSRHQPCRRISKSHSLSCWSWRTPPSAVYVCVNGGPFLAGAVASPRSLAATRCRSRRVIAGIVAAPARNAAGYPSRLTGSQHVPVCLCCSATFYARSRECITICITMVRSDRL